MTISPVPRTCRNLGQSFDIFVHFPKQKLKKVILRLVTCLDGNAELVLSPKGAAQEPEGGHNRPRILGVAHQFIHAVAAE